MRRVAILKIAAVLGAFAFAFSAYAEPHLVVDAHRGAVFSLALAMLASGFAAKLTVPVALFGWHGRMSAPLALPVAVSIILRFAFWGALGSALADRLSRRARESAAAPAAGLALCTAGPRRGGAGGGGAGAQVTLRERRCPHCPPPL